MADIYVRPYGSGPRFPWKRLIGTLLAAGLAAAAWYGWSRRTETPQQPEAEQPAATTETESSAPAENGGSGGAEANRRAEDLFGRARDLVRAGQKAQAAETLQQIVDIAAEPGLRNDALRVLGRLNMELFLSDTPGRLKRSYVVQPGDSLDKIARQQKTTIELIRRINDIEGNLIYPGQRLLLPAAPLVVRVDKAEKTLDLTLNGTLIKRYAVGLGRGGKTPTGTFRTVVHQTNPDWTPPGGGIVKFGDPRNVLGTRWISIHDQSRPELKGFGIHGTSQRDSIGGETSNGCVRMLNEDVEELFMIIPRGTEVIISE